MAWEEALTTREAAAELGRSPAAVRSYVRFCGLPATRRGVQTFIRREDLAEWRARPEIREMLSTGDRLHASRKAAV